MADHKTHVGEESTGTISPNDSQEVKQEKNGTPESSKKIPDWHLPQQWLVLSAFVSTLVAIGVWLYATKSLVADYVPLMFVFFSAVVGIAGKSWDDTQSGLSRITVKGRILAALAILGLIVGIRNIQMTHVKLQATSEIQTVAYHQLLKGVSMMLFPITSSWRDPPKNDLDVLARAQNAKTIDLLRNTRIVPFADPTQETMTMIGDPRLFLITPNGVRIASSCGYPHRGFRALYELFDFCVDGGEAKVKESEQIFGSSLDPETIKLLQDVLNDEFYISQYKNLSQHDDLYYQGIYDEAGASNSLMNVDRTWRALIEIQHNVLPNKDHPSARNEKKGPSPWLYLGTYYFGRNSDSAAYRSFLDKVGALVKHVDALTNSKNLIDTF